MQTAFKKNKELDVNYIENMQDDMFDMMVCVCYVCFTVLCVCVRAHGSHVCVGGMPCSY